MTPLRVIIGAGEQRWEGWQPTQQADLDLTDPASFERFFGGRRADAFLCEHVWEHLSVAQGQAAARLCFAHLKPGGLLRVAVPDANFPDPEYQRTVQVGGPGPADHPAAGHQVVYDHGRFAELFRLAGFGVTPLEYFDEAGRFHQRDWNPADGPIYRSALLDHRNARFWAEKGPLGFSSIILDVRKPTTSSTAPAGAGTGRP